MKIEMVCAAMLLLALPSALSASGAGGASAGGSASGSSSEKTPPKEPVQCKIEILKSYMLKGRHKASESPLYLCPTVTSNCCTKTDQQKMYHIVNDIVPGRVLEYESKMKLALAKLKNLHNTIMDKQPNFSGSSRRREFCNQQARKVYNFPFNFFYNHALEEMEMIRSEMDDYYEKFFCTICDGNNHQFFNIKGRTPNIMMKGEFCKEMLKSNQDIIKLFNVELVEYLVSLQHLVDCTHYIKSYNLKFFDERKQKMMSEISECINNVESSNFLKSCQSTCEMIKISKIVDLIEGDFEFLIDAVNLFEKFFELKESGNLVSMKLRKFFQRFVIPRKLKQDQQSLFLDQVKSDVEGSRALKAPTPKAPERKLRKHPVKAAKKPKQHLHHGRLLAEASAGGQAGGNSTGSGNNTTDNSTFPFQKRTAKLVYNRDLFHFYDEITIQGPEKGQLVFRINEPPVDLDTLPKTFGLGVGINPMDYNTKFSLPQDVFYKMLFSYRKPDVPDTNLMFFLVDFNAKNHEILKEDITTHFKIEVPEDEEEGDGSKHKKRVLAELPTKKIVLLPQDKKMRPL